jgi:hypothetical protein
MKRMWNEGKIGDKSKIIIKIRRVRLKIIFYNY